MFSSILLRKLREILGKIPFYPFFLHISGADVIDGPKQGNGKKKLADDY